MDGLQLLWIDLISVESSQMLSWWIGSILEIYVHVSRVMIHVLSRELQPQIKFQLLLIFI